MDNEVGAAAATGNGDEMMKVCLAFALLLNGIGQRTTGGVRGGDLDRCASVP